MSIWKLSKKFVLCCVLFIGGILLLIQAFIHMADDKKAPMDYNAISVSDINKNALQSAINNMKRFKRRKLRKKVKLYVLIIVNRTYHNSEQNGKSETISD